MATVLNSNCTERMQYIVCKSLSDNKNDSLHVFIDHDGSIRAKLRHTDNVQLRHGCFNWVTAEAHAITAAEIRDVY